MIFTPGPVEVSSSVLQASMKHMNHRSQEFRDIMQSSLEVLRNISGSKRVSLTTGSGTLAVEMLIWSILSRKEKVIAATYGEFGDRMIESLERRGCIVYRIAKEENDIIRPEEISELASNSGATTIFLVHNETGNGTQVANLKELAGTAKKSGMKVLVDSVSGFAALSLELDTWGIDAVATCGHKGIASVTGIGVNMLGDSLESSLTKEDTPAYLDLEKSLHFMERNETPFTPSTGAFSGLSEALDELAKEGIKARIDRTSGFADMLVKRLLREGYSITGNRDTRSKSVLNVLTRNKSTVVSSSLRNRGFIVGNGLGKFKEKTIRIGLMGSIKKEDIENLLDEFLKIDQK
ncbi:MAG: aminotransferase class V-fold PLP-dependent enzyme [Candidatus Thermoplasmatota archaeon]|nr:aminotransferase class V-fold PLP-dependent enzyme [Candidatus Thermoplasmatota archaeon]